MAHDHHICMKMRFIKTLDTERMDRTAHKQIYSIKIWWIEDCTNTSREDPKMLPFPSASLEHTVLCYTKRRSDMRLCRLVNKRRPPPCQFLTLPTEVRLMIYEHATFESGTCNVDVYGKPIHPLLHLNKLIREEAFEAVHRHAVLSFRLHDLGASSVSWRVTAPSAEATSEDTRP